MIQFYKFTASGQHGRLGKFEIRGWWIRTDDGNVTEHIATYLADMGLDCRCGEIYLQPVAKLPRGFTIDGPSDRPIFL
ncbi:hypothetical protein DB346_02950 [Verrucomicrobia bacterium LW23]|nr:hypothetical protein DB346_03705 [Verrucomicrobia bacterium LW23]PTY04407.1 hypothetical protein DB346_02950 [Verrucomicrobia bacterium LW23]